MLEIRFHTKGGQGAIAAARILTDALHLAGREASWFIPVVREYTVNFATVLSYEDKNSEETSLSALVVFHPQLLGMLDLWISYENPDLVLINARETLSVLNLSGGQKIAIIDASEIAGKSGEFHGIPGLVAPMLGALAAAGDIVLERHLVEAIENMAHELKLTHKDLERLIYALEEGYNKIRIRTELAKSRRLASDRLVEKMRKRLQLVGQLETGETAYDSEGSETGEFTGAGHKKAVKVG